jgi:hypothetical protein
MAQRTLTGTVKVQVSKYFRLDELDADDAKLFARLQFSDSDMSEYGNSVVGTAEVTVTLNTPDTIIGDKVEALRAEAKKVQADAYKRCTEIEHQVQQLLAITLDPAVQS